MSCRNPLAAFCAILLGAAALFGQASDGPSAPTALVNSPVAFIGITPCRIADTRDAGMPLGYGPPALGAGELRPYQISGRCGIPDGALAVSLNVTAVAPLTFGFVLLWPQGETQPGVSTLNFVPGQTVANAAIVPLSIGGAITVKAVVSGTDFIIDTNGYYAPSAVDDTNTFLGLGAGNPSTPAVQNTGFGWGALGSVTTGVDNTAFGAYALSSNQDGSGNTAFGVSALRTNTSGVNNSAFGDGALALNTTGSDNVAVGVGALGANVSGDRNTAVGGYALANSTGSFNTALGYNAGLNLTTGNNNVYIGDVGAASESNTLRIGAQGLQTRFFLAGVFGIVPGVPGPTPVFVDSNGQVGTQVSSARYKEDVRDMDEDSRAILRLRPVSFRYTGQPEKHYGLVAEEVEQVLPELVVHDDAGLPEAVASHELPAMLLNEVQRQRRDLERLEDADRRLEAELQDRERETVREERELEELRARVAPRAESP